MSGHGRVVKYKEMFGIKGIYLLTSCTEMNTDILLEHVWIT